MNTNEKKPFLLRALVLITSPKLEKKASDLFQQGAVPIQYQWNARGTAPTEISDILGLGSDDKSILITTLPKPFAEKMMKKIKKELKIGKADSGIVFTIPLSGANNLVFHMLNDLKIEDQKLMERKDEMVMMEPKHTLIVAVVNQGYSEDVMDIAREVGARGGTIVHSRRIGNKEVMGFWGLSIQEEKEMLLIVTKKENKVAIMQAIAKNCGMHSKAKGIVLSLPIDSVLGLDEDDE